MTLVRYILIFAWIFFFPNKLLAKAVSLDSLTHKTVDSMLEAKNAQYLIFISDNDCISCMSFVSRALDNKECTSLFIASNNNFFDYLAEMGKKIPANNVVKNTKLAKTLAAFNKGSMLLYREGVATIGSKSLFDKDIDKIFCSGGQNHKVKIKEIKLNDQDLSVEDFKNYNSYYNKTEGTFNFGDFHYGFWLSFTSALEFKKNKIQIMEQTQNFLFDVIKKDLKVPNVMFADSARDLDANKILKIMSQPKIIPLFINDSYFACYTNYSTQKDSTNYDISKVVTIFRRNQNTLKLLKVFDKLELNNTHLYIRPQKINFFENYLIIPFLDTDPMGIPTDHSSIHLALYDLNKKEYYLKPDLLINTGIKQSNINNVTFTADADQIVLCDNFNEEYLTINRRTATVVKSKYTSLGIKYVYDMHSENGKISIIYNDSEGKACLGMLSLQPQIRLRKVEEIMDSYLDFAYFNNGVVNGHKINIDSNFIYFIH